ncbi:pyridoxamine 5'-phosphate oxidase family protein [Nocardia sp. NPDC057353]|uniref:pyridoxamine 5'-phosphate oxidase family protein n=1 Tax=Nocardia sp. NPDC057353 TaxID=3346104 RepID=UPI00362509BB
MAAGASLTEHDHSADEHPELDVLPVWPTETIAVLVTTDPSPHAIPVSWPVRAGDRRILISLKFDRGSLARLRAQPQVALLILGGGDVALCARGTATVLADGMPGASDYVPVQIDVDTIDDHRQSAFTVAQGIQRTVLDEAELDALRGRVATLREWAEQQNPKTEG